MARPRRLLNVKDVLERLVCLDQDLDREAIRGNLTIADFNDLIFKDELHSMANVAILILSSAKRKGRKDVRIEE